MSVGNLKLSKINISENTKFLDLIERYNDNLELEFTMTHDELLALIKRYMKDNIEFIGDIDEYDCIYPEIINIDDNIKFTLNAEDLDSDDSSDLINVLKEGKRHFGVDISKCKIEDILRILFIDCKDYKVTKHDITTNIYYKNYKETKIGEYLSKYQDI